MGVNVLCAVRVKGCVSSGSKKAGCDSNMRCIDVGLMSPEIHGTKALHWLPLVKAVCKHGGWTLGRFIAWSLSSSLRVRSVKRSSACVWRNLRMCMHVNQVKQFSVYIEEEGCLHHGRNISDQAVKNDTKHMKHLAWTQAFSTCTRYARLKSRQLVRKVRTICLHRDMKDIC